MGIHGGFDPLEGFVIHDIDESDATYYYYGYLNVDGVGIIMRKTTADPSAIRYDVTKNYDTDWTNRASLTYQKIDQF